jgi:hypothetical protein
MTTAGKAARRRIGGLLGALVAVAALAVPASALAAPVLELDANHYYLNGSFGGEKPVVDPVLNGTYSHYDLKLLNTGSTATTGAMTVNFTVPAGLKIVEVSDPLGEQFSEIFGVPVHIWECSGSSLSVSCAGMDATGELGGPFAIPAHGEACTSNGELGAPCHLLVTVEAEPNTPAGTLQPTATVCGGGASSCPAVADTAPVDSIDVAPFDWHIVSADGENLEENGEPDALAGSHPYTAGNKFSLNTYVTRHGQQVVPDELQDAIVKLPPGQLANPLAYPTCTQPQLAVGGCPADSQIGTVAVDVRGSFGFNFTAGVFNMHVPQGLPALFAFNLLGNVTEVYATVRTGEDYGITLTVKNNPQTIAIAGTDFAFWGVPAAAGHDAERGACFSGTATPPCPSTSPERPFVSLPTFCSTPMETELEVTGWEGGTDSQSFLSHAPGEPQNTLPNGGCNAVPFAPTITARPTTNIADAASGLDVDIHLPQNENASGRAEAQLKDATIKLPPGLVLNPSAGNGLVGCAPAEVDLHGKGPAQCPDASKLGTVSVNSPLIDNPLPGAVYLATPYNNPFNSLFALYIGVSDPQTDVVIKLAGEVTLDPATGQLTATFKENPQLPFNDFELHFFGGAGGALRTPPVCGSYSATSSLVPWTTPDGATMTPKDEWEITQGPNGRGCIHSEGEEPNGPSLDAGTVSPVAGAYSPMVVSLRREDGSQNFSSISLTPPPGLIGKLAGIPYCPASALEAAAAKTGTEEEANPSCPAASEVGVVDVAAGAGPAPYHAHGKAYLTAPYKGAPLGLAVITPATAGPFDLGTVVTRVALFIDSKTAQITAKADPLPTILQGIPLDVRAVQIKLDRPEFTLNPTSCNAMSFTGQLVSSLGQSAGLQNRFQLGECGRLGLEPKLSLSLKGGTKRRAHPSLTAVLEPGAGNANLSTVSVALPPTELLDQGHIGTVCSRVQFAASECPADSVYGTATVKTPLTDYELSGPVYLRSNPNGNGLPDLVPDLRGPASQPIKLEATGHTDTTKAGALRNTFEGIPDAPFSKLVLSLSGGAKGLIQNNTNICAKTYRATVKYQAQNGLTLTQTPAVKAPCPKHKRPHRHSRRSGHTRAVR